MYKRYLGALAAELPTSGVLLPIALRTREVDTGVVRMVLGIDEGANAVRSAGEVAEGMYVRLTKASSDRLIDAAAAAANLAALGSGDARDRASADSSPDDASAATLALVVRCVGRRWMLRQRVEDELEAVRDALGGSLRLAGLSSYGEIAPVGTAGGCQYHNQTLTLTTLCER